MKRSRRSLVGDRRGATAVEYAFLLVAVLGATAGSVRLLGGAPAAAIDRVAVALDAPAEPPAVCGTRGSH